MVNSCFRYFIGFLLLLTWVIPVFGVVPLAINFVKKTNDMFDKIFILLILKVKQGPIVEESVLTSVTMRIEKTNMDILLSSYTLLFSQVREKLT